MTRRVDLCDEHGESLRGLFDVGKLVNDSARLGGPARVIDAASAAVPPESRRLRRETERDELHAVMRAQRRTGRHASAAAPKPAPKQVQVTPTPAATVAKPAPV
ncbi:hypothetical protein, partial [Kribbia dieselivorans]|uniref:hypothetical protein n=1 Tax=Kribbia dieselivorans TaxID=331526 RepID=UPI001C3F26D4